MSAQPRASTRARLEVLFGDRRGMVALLALSSIVAGLAEAGILAIIAQVAGAVVNGAKRVSIEHGPLQLHASVGALLAFGIGLALFRLALQAPLSILPARIAAGVQSRLRRDLFGAFTRASWDVQSRDREGHLQETMTSQVIQATGATLQATTLMTALFTFIVLMASALALNIVAAGVVLGATALLFGALRPLNSLGSRRARALSQAQMEYAGGVGEAIRLTEETHVFGVAAAQRARVERLIAGAKGLFFETQMIARLIPNLYQSLILLLLVVGLDVLHHIGAGRAPWLGAIALLLLRAGTFGQQVQGAYQSLRQSLPFVERLQASEERYALSTPVTGERPLRSVRTLAFEQVCFAYRPERPVLCDVSFQVSAGEAIGIVGPSGAGKSTLMQLLLQLRRPSRGRYLVNGAPAHGYERADWHRLVAYVPQEPRLLHASVAENISYFRDLDQDAIERAARLARIHDDIVSWPAGYQTIVGPRADAVSGGQQQRICLARALAAQPEMLVLDEPTSALDPHSERLIQESLEALKSELTMFIVAHRLSTLDVCNRVMVVLDGRLAAFDELDRLRQENPYYRSAVLIAGGGSDGWPPVSGDRPPASEVRAAASAVREAASDVRAAASAVREAASEGRPAAQVQLPPDRGEGTAVPHARLGPPAQGAAEAVVKHPAGRLPDFFIVGQPKSGTTALYEMLRAHPEIYMPDGKEPWFFASELHVRTPPRPGGTPRTLSEYTALFEGASPQQLAGEGSALYLWSRTAAQRIADAQPRARIIAILREPASLLRSLHLQFVQTYVETENDLRKALALEQERSQGRNIPRYSYWPDALIYSEHVRYVQQLERYRAVFPEEQILVLIYDDFRSDNEATVRQVLRFLDVDDAVEIAPREANPTVRARSQQGLELLHAVSVGRGPVSLAVKGALKAALPRDVRRNALHATQRRIIFTTPKPPDERLVAELRSRYKPEVVALGEYLGRDLVSLWGYGDVG